MGLISPNDNGYLGFYGRQGLYFRPVINNGTVDTNYGVTMESTGLFPGSTNMPLGKASNPWGNIYTKNIEFIDAANDTTNIGTLKAADDLTAGQAWILPDDSGTIALTKNIPTISNATITITQTGNSNSPWTFTLNGSATTIALNDNDTLNTAGASNWAATSNRKLYLVGTDNSVANSAITYTDAANLYIDSSHALHAKEYIENGTPIAQLYRTPEIKRYI